MNILSFYWPHNGPFKKDGDWFEAQSEAFIDFFKEDFDYAQEMEIIKMWKGVRRKRILSEIEKLKQKDMQFNRIAFFCHGWPKSFDAGFNVSNIGLLGEQLNKIADDDCRIYLFCCSTGKLENGLAAKLSLSSGLPVFAHSTSGRAVRNPYKWVFQGDWRIPLFPDPKDKEAWKHHKEEVDENPFGFLEMVEL